MQINRVHHGHFKIKIKLKHIWKDKIQVKYNFKK